VTLPSNPSPDSRPTDRRTPGWKVLLVLIVVIAVISTVIIRGVQ
jgi:hypothetical protein